MPVPLLMPSQGFGGPAGLCTALADQFGTQGAARIVNWYPPSSYEFLGAIGILSWILGTATGYGGDLAPMAGAMVVTNPSRSKYS